MIQYNIMVFIEFPIHSYKKLVKILFVIFYLKRISSFNQNCFHEYLFSIQRFFIGNFQNEQKN